MDQTTSITQKRKSAGNEDDSSEDEFEKEMTAELNATMSTIEKEHVTGVHQLKNCIPFKYKLQSIQLYLAVSNISSH